MKFQKHTEEYSKRKLSHENSTSSKKQRKDDTTQVIPVPDTVAQYRSQRIRKTPARYRFSTPIKPPIKTQYAVAKSTNSAAIRSTNSIITNSNSSAVAGCSNSDSPSAANLFFNSGEVSRVKTKGPPVRNFYDSIHRQEIVLMKPATSITLMANIQVNCLRGEAELYGYSLAEGATVSALSTKNLGLVSVKATGYSHAADKEGLQSLLLNHDCCEDIVESYESDMTVLKLSDAPMDDGLKFLDKTYRSVIQTIHEKRRNKFFKMGSEDAMVFDNLEFNIKSIHKEVEAAKKVNKTSKILVCGSRNYGKSTTLRYCINAHLSKFKEPVYYLDLDLGQSEFGPPGLISLVEITKPLLGPGFSHLKKPIKMMVVGSIRPDMATEKFNHAVNTLHSYFMAHYGEHTLFINTMGWITGFGRRLLQVNVKVISPTIVIYMAGDETSYPVSFSKNTKLLTLKSQTKYSKPSYPPNLMRDLMLTSYFGTCFHYCGIPNSVNRNLPKMSYSIPWKEIAIHPTDMRDADPKVAMQSILGNMVALCIVPHKYIKPDKNGLLQIVGKNFNNECVAYGIVRYIDEDNQSLGIMTPVNFSKIAKVNALVLLNVKIPKCMVKDQEECSKDAPLPYCLKCLNNTTVGNFKPSRNHSLKDKAKTP